MLCVCVVCFTKLTSNKVEYSSLNHISSLILLTPNSSYFAPRGLKKAMDMNTYLIDLI